VRNARHRSGRVRRGRIELVDQDRIGKGNLLAVSWTIISGSGEVLGSSTVTMLSSFAFARTLSSTKKV